MKTNRKSLPFPMLLAAQKPATVRPWMGGCFPKPRLSWSSLYDPPVFRLQRRLGRTSPRPAEPAFIYAVDDLPHLTELYRALLEKAGHTVKTFNERTQALAALAIDVKKPDLLITDYRGVSMSADQFICACRRVHPKIRILMASGFDAEDMHFVHARPDRFIHKPFTQDELHRLVQACLAEIGS